MSSSGMGTDVQPLMLSIQHLLCQPRRRSPPRDTVVECDMPEPRKFPSLDSCQKRFLWTHKEFGLAPHPVVGLVLQVGNVEVFSGTWFRKPGPFFSESAVRFSVKL